MNLLSLSFLPGRQIFITASTSDFGKCQNTCWFHLFRRFYFSFYKFILQVCMFFLVHPLSTRLTLKTYGHKLNLISIYYAMKTSEKTWRMINEINLQSSLLVILPTFLPFLRFDWEPRRPARIVWQTVLLANTMLGPILTKTTIRDLQMTHCERTILLISTFSKPNYQGQPESPLTLFPF